MSFDALPECRKVDAVLALHLDGDIGGGAKPDESGFDFVCVESLHSHLLDCASCQQQLQRARRLDAVLAAGASSVAVSAASSSSSSPHAAATSERAAIAPAIRRKLVGVIVILPRGCRPFSVW